MSFKTIEWRDGQVVMIDQRLLPGREIYNTYADSEGVAVAIETMVIRGAPAIGIAAAMGAAIASARSSPWRIACFSSSTLMALAAAARISARVLRRRRSRRERLAVSSTRSSLVGMIERHRDFRTHYRRHV